jgi:hypothetical protein
MSKLFKEPGDDLPVYIDVTLEDFIEYRETWLLWRSTGRRNASNGFEPAISFLEAATRLPNAMLSTFQTLDSVFAKMESQWLKKLAKKKEQQ